jgi:ribonuclease BN (tRNA processing enzyme)
MNHFLFVNGLAHAFLKEFGCACPRCARTLHVANTSASLVSLDADGQTAHHVLFDVGNGVVESLMHNPQLAGERARLDWLVFTHWHTDHAMEVRRLCESWRRTREWSGQAFQHIPTWCRRGSAEWLTIEQGRVMRNHLDLHISDEAHPAGTVLAPLPIALLGLTITPITTYHGSADLDPANPTQHYPCCAGFVLQTPTKKAALLWDLDTTNHWITEAGNAAAQLASNADYLFMDCNTWRREINPANGRSTNHVSFFTVMKYAAALQPRLTLLVHLSGHEDERGDGWGWDDAEWERNAQREWRAHNLRGEVRVPKIGEAFALS